MGTLENIRSFVGKFKWQRPTSALILLCPKCRSKNIRLSTGLDVGLTPQRYICTDCGYLGPIVLEIEKEKTKREH